MGPRTLWCMVGGTDVVGSEAGTHYIWQGPGHAPQCWRRSVRRARVPSQRPELVGSFPAARVGLDGGGAVGQTAGDDGTSGVVAVVEDVGRCG